jgi:phosphoribosylformylglycinamidine synthase
MLATVVESCFAGGCGAEIDLPAFGDPMRAVFNEELGALLQVPAERADQIVADMRADGLAGCVHDIGSVTTGQAIRFHHDGQIFLEGDRGEWRTIWGSVSHRIAKRRDNPVCADEERDLPADDPGLQPHLTFPLEHNPAATYSRRPRVAILREQGVNGQLEMAAAFHQAGFEAVDVHMSDLIAGREDLTSMTGLAACGGFSYGDVLGAGGGWAKSIVYDPEVRAIFERFFARPDTFSLGVCNGCQMLSQLRDLIPGADHWPRFLHNTSAQFEARYVMTEVLSSPSIFFQGMEGSRIPIAIAHGEGRVAWQSDGDAANANIALRYVDNHGQATERYPLNPNGSPGGVTALTSADGRATILMPHPERVFRTLTCSWTPDDWGEFSPWMRFFRNARAWCGE